MIINDSSDDATGDVLDGLSLLKSDSRFTVVHRDQQHGSLANYLYGFKALDAVSEPEAILVTVDGDDRLFSEEALSIVFERYKKTGCMLTYGNHIHYPTGHQSNCYDFPPEVVRHRTYRNCDRYISSHLRTFRAKLWNNIRDEDLQNQDGNYYSLSADVAVMIPMLEMADGRYEFIREILYLYNVANPLGWMQGDKVALVTASKRVLERIQSRPTYDPL